MLPFAILGVYALAYLEHLVKPSTASVAHVEVIGASFAMHVRAGIAGLTRPQPPSPSRTTYEPPTRVIELANPSASFSIRRFHYQPMQAGTSLSGTGALVALMLVILWVLTLLALWLTFKARISKAANSAPVLANATLVARTRLKWISPGRCEAAGAYLVPSPPRPCLRLRTT
ncbi:hypothetical protein JB92DRAFT_2200906 [Gautieria morchelliformis]|nr:hypothetical protein JB92DRAFT_2200906 [Gautieria morchelliformis]